MPEGQNDPQPFDENTVCAKCGSTDASIAYSIGHWNDGIGRGNPMLPPPAPMMWRTCLRCRNYWNELPLDCKENPDA